MGSVDGVEPLAWIFLAPAYRGYRFLWGERVALTSRIFTKKVKKTRLSYQKSV